MPQVAKVIAIRNRKIWITRLYLWTKSNTRPTGGTKSEFYPRRPCGRPEDAACARELLLPKSDPEQRADDHRNNEEPQEAHAPLPQPLGEAPAGVLEIHGAVLSQDGDDSGRVRICSSHACLLSPRHSLSFGRRLNQGNP